MGVVIPLLAVAVAVLFLACTLLLMALRAARVRADMPYRYRAHEGDDWDTESYGGTD